MKNQKKFSYTVRAHFNMGMSDGTSIYEFESVNDRAAKQHLRRLAGGQLGDMKRNVRFDMSTLSRIV